MAISTRYLAPFVGCAVWLLASCTTAEDDLVYPCAQSNAPNAAVSCEGRVADILRLTPELEACEVLHATFVPSSELDAVIIPFTEYYSSRRVSASLSAPFNWVVNVGSERERKTLFLRVPTGYMTDFTSSPPGVVQMFIRTFTKHIFPSIAHDFLYAVGPADTGDSAEPGQNPESWYKRAFADDVLVAGIARNESREITKATIKAGVRLGGEKAFGAEEEFKFFVRDPVAKPRVVVPIADWHPRNGHALLRERYVKICNYNPKWD